MAKAETTFAARLRSLREAAGVNQSELARRAGLTRQALSMLEAGERQPTLATTQALARALGLTLDALAG